MKTCSGNGNCISYNHCECYEGYAGNACQGKILINNIDKIDKPQQGTFAWVALGIISFLVFVTILLLFAIIIYMYNNKKKRKQESEFGTLIDEE